MGVTKITRNYQVTIPKDVRKATGLREGDRVLFAIEGDRVELRKVEEDVVRAAAGLWRDLKETGLQYERGLRRRWTERLRRQGV